MPPFPQQHDHTITFGFTTGSDWVRTVVVCGALLVTASAFVRPFVPDAGRSARIAVTAVAGGVLLLLLLLADGLDMPQQAVAAVLAVAAVPLAVARHRTVTPIAARARGTAPWMVGAAGTLATVELVRMVLSAGDPAEAARLVHTSIVLGLLALSWLTVGHPRRPGRHLPTHVAGWLVGMVVLAGVTSVAVGGIAT